MANDVGTYSYGLVGDNVASSSPSSTTANATADGVSNSLEKTIPLGVFFHNTVYDYSRFVIDTPIAGLTDGATTGNENEWVNVTEYGVVGDGSDETDKLQAILDNAAITGNRSKVLIPAGLNVTVKPKHIDNCQVGYYGPMWICLFVESNVTIRIDGTVTLMTKTANEQPYQSYGGDYTAVFANKNSFRCIYGSGTTAAYNNFIPSGFTGDTQGFINSGAHTNGVSSSTIQLTGSPDLSGVVAEDYTPFPDEVCDAAPLRMGILGVSEAYRYGDIVSVDNTNKTVTLSRSFNIASGSPKKYFIENNYVDHDISFEGNGTIDCNGYLLGSDFYAYAFRFARVKHFRISGIKIKRAANVAIYTGLSQYVTFRDVIIEQDPDENNCGSDGDIALDTCNHVLIDGCRFISRIDAAVYTGSFLSTAGKAGAIGVFSWSTRNLMVTNCLCINHAKGGTGVGGLVQLQGYGMECNEVVTGNIWGGFFDSRDPRISWKQATSDGEGTVDTSSYIPINWNCIISNNISRNNIYGVCLLGETFYGEPGYGIKVLGNILNNNQGNGVAIGTCEAILIQGNTIKNNGFLKGNIYYFD